jgi:hypothetical protein
VAIGAGLGPARRWGVWPGLQRCGFGGPAAKSKLRAAMDLHCTIVRPRPTVQLLLSVGSSLPGLQSLLPSRARAIIRADGPEGWCNARALPPTLATCATVRCVSAGL